MYVIFSMRKMMLTSRINRLQAKLMDLHQKLQDITSYGMNLASGIIGPEAFMNTPASVFGRQNAFMNQNVAMALVGASQATELYKQNFLAQNSASAGQLGYLLNPNNPQAALPNDAMLFSMFFRKALESGSMREQMNVRQTEMRIQSEKQQIETQLKTAEAELQKVEQAEDKGIEKSAPKYA